MSASTRLPCLEVRRRPMRFVSDRRVTTKAPLAALCSVLLLVTWAWAQEYPLPSWNDGPAADNPAVRSGHDGLVQLQVRSARTAHCRLRPGRHHLGRAAYLSAVGLPTKDPCIPWRSQRQTRTH